MLRQTIRHKKELNKCVINRDVKRIKHAKADEVDCLVIGGFIGFLVAMLIRINFNV